MHKVPLVAHDLLFVSFTPLNPQSIGLNLFSLLTTAAAAAAHYMLTQAPTVRDPGSSCAGPFPPPSCPPCFSQ